MHSHPAPNLFDGCAEYVRQFALSDVHCHSHALWNNPTYRSFTSVVSISNFWCGWVHNSNKFPNYLPVAVQGKRQLGVYTGIHGFTLIRWAEPIALNIIISALYLLFPFFFWYFKLVSHCNICGNPLDRNFCIWYPNNFPAISPSILVRFTRFLARSLSFIVSEMLRAFKIENDLYFHLVEKSVSNGCFCQVSAWISRMGTDMDYRELVEVCKDTQM